VLQAGGSPKDEMALTVRCTRGLETPLAAQPSRDRDEEVDLLNRNEGTAFGALPCTGIYDTKHARCSGRDAGLSPPPCEGKRARYEAYSHSSFLVLTVVNPAFAAVVARALA
jgi:hypothetical protein